MFRRGATSARGMQGRQRLFLTHAAPGKDAAVRDPVPEWCVLVARRRCRMAIVSCAYLAC